VDTSYGSIGSSAVGAVPGRRTVRETDQRHPHLGEVPPVRRDLDAGQPLADEEQRPQLLGQQLQAALELGENRVLAGQHLLQMTARRQTVRGIERRDSRPQLAVVLHAAQIQRRGAQLHRQHEQPVPAVADVPALALLDAARVAKSSSWPGARNADRHSAWFCAASWM
jgi:hypothetical protein